MSNKTDELHQVTLLNKSSVLCVTEIWLTPSIPNSAISIPGYTIFRKDRHNQTGGGVCAYISNKIPCKRLTEYDQDGVESLWISRRPNSLPRSIILLGIVYHSTANREMENIELRDHIQVIVDNFLNKYPNALVIITGDFNPTSTGLDLNSIAKPNQLKQLV